MRTLRSLSAIAFAGSLVLGACESNAPTEPLSPELSLEDELTLALLEDPSTTTAALDLVGVQTAAANRRGYGWGAGNAQGNQAQARFQEARQALAQGDQVQARERAREARRLLAQGIELAGGLQAMVGMVERLEALPLAVAADPELFADPGRLGLQLGQLAVQARKALRTGDATGAGALCVLAEQAFRQQIRSGSGAGIAGRADLAVALASEAVEMANRILGDNGGISDAEAQDLLATAEEYLSLAQAALEAGEDARASHLAHLAQWWALKAVVLPGGITDEEADFIHSVASELLEQAGAAVELDPTELKVALLARATRLFQQGEENLANGTCRGIGALWQSAVISSFLVG